MHAGLGLCSTRWTDYKTAEEMYDRCTVKDIQINSSNRPMANHVHLFSVQIYSRQEVVIVQ